MTRTQRWITLGILLALAAACAFFTAHVLTWQKPDQLHGFQNRFANPAGLGFRPGEGVEMALTDGQLRAAWADTQADALCLAAGEAVAAQGSEICVSVYAGGKQNAWASGRWGYQVWLELSLYRDGREVETARAELPLESEKGRARVCAVRAAVRDGFDAYTMRVWITPADGMIAAGELTLANWEVDVR